MAEENSYLGGMPARISHIARTNGTRNWLHLLGPAGEIATLTYRQFVQLALRWTAAYQSAGVTQGGRAIILLDHSVELYASHCGAVISGIVPAIFAPPSPKQDREMYFQALEQLIDSAGASIIITSEELLSEIESGLSRRQNMPVITAASDAAPNELQVSINSDDLAILQYSSGTTGLKKGVEFSHRAVLWQIDRHAAAIGLNDTDTIVSWLPLYHDMGFVACYLTPLLTGVPLVAMSPFDWVKKPEMLLEAIAEYSGTLCWQPNFAYNFLAANAPADKSYDLSAVRRFYNCSEPVFDNSHAAFLERFQSCGVTASKLAVCYAMAENVFAVTLTPPERPARVDIVDASELRDNRRAVPVHEGQSDVRRIVSCGVPLPRTGIKIVDPRRRSVKSRNLGEIAIQSPALFTAYHGNHAATAEVRDQSWYYTGDLGYIADGELFVVGRIKDTIIVGGKNLFPEDIEQVVSRIDGVVPGRCVAFGVSDSVTGTERLVVAAETQAKDRASRDRLRMEIRTIVSAKNDVSVYDVAIVDHMWLVKSTSGKISRGRNKQRYLELLNERHDAASASDNPDEVDELTSEVLKTTVSALRGQIGSFAENITVTTPLISSGMVDSLSIAVLFSALESRFGVRLPETVIQNIQDFDTVAEISKNLAQFGATADAPKEPQATQQQNVDWHSRLSANIDGWNEAVNEIAPQLSHAKSLGGADSQVAIAKILEGGRGYASRANFRSQSLNTDENGFRITIIDGKPIRLSDFQSSVARRGFLFGSSSSFGVGTRSDEAVLHNRFNETGGADAVKWFNFSLRGSNLKTEVTAGKFLEGQTAEAVLFFSGLNDFRFFTDFLTGLEASRNEPITPDDLEALYAKFKDEIGSDLKACRALADGLGASVSFCLQLGLPALAGPKTFSDEETKLQENMRTSDASKFGDYWVVTNHFESLIERYRNDFAQACKALEIPFYDPNNPPEFQSDAWLFNDYWHYTDQGHELLSRLISKHLLEHVVAP